MSNGPLDVRFVFPETNAVSLGGVPCIYLLFAASARYAADDGALRAEPYR